MARLTTHDLAAFRAAAALLLAATASACARPQAADPVDPPSRAEAAPELLGAPAAELANPPEPIALAVSAPPVRRAGWGTMAPIPNPDDGGPRYARGDPAPYRLVGPGPAEIEAAPGGPSLRTDNRARFRGRIRVVAEPTGHIQNKPRVRHLIMPATGGR